MSPFWPPWSELQTLVTFCWALYLACLAFHNIWQHLFLPSLPSPSDLYSSLVALPSFHLAVSCAWFPLFEPGLATSLGGCGGMKKGTVQQRLPVLGCTAGVTLTPSALLWPSPCLPWGFGCCWTAFWGQGLSGRWVLWCLLLCGCPFGLGWGLCWLSTDTKSAPESQQKLLGLSLLLAYPTCLNAKFGNFINYLLGRVSKEARDIKLFRSSS